MIIFNGKIITWTDDNQILENHAILINDGVIVEICEEKELIGRYPEEEKLDAEGQYVMPGLICAHTHFYGAYARGLAIPGDPPSAFPEILRDLWWALDKSLDEKSIQSSAWVCVLDAIKHGTTTLIDHHASPNAISGSLDIIADVVEKSGVRASLCYEVTDRDGLEKAKQGIGENVRFLKRLKENNNLGGRLAGTFGLHASLTLSNGTLEASKAANPDGETGFHIHVAEHPVDEYDSLKKSGTRVVDRLNQFGILGENTIVAHAVHVDAREIALLNETGTWVTHQPRSNMNNAVGIANIESMIRTGINVGLGNDGFSNTMWDEWKTAYLVHKSVNGDPRKMGADQIAKMAIYKNAELVSKQFGVPIGQIASGQAADLIFVDYQPFTPLNTGNLPWHIVFGFHHSMVTMTMVAGKVLMKNRSLINIDEKEIMSHAMEQAKPVWDRYQAQF